MSETRHSTAFYVVIILLVLAVAAAGLILARAMTPARETPDQGRDGMTASQAACEAAGQEFLRKAEEAFWVGLTPASLEGVTQQGDTYIKTVSDGDTTLTIVVKAAEGGRCEVVDWQMDPPADAGGQPADE